MMDQSEREAIVEISRRVRRMFHQMSALGNALHADLGVTVGMRGMMETLVRQGPMTVPAIARLRPVSRQHAQRLVDVLAEKGFVRFQGNPNHKRSPVVELTENGRRVFDEMSRREAQYFDTLAATIAQEDAATALRVLDQLAARFDGWLSDVPRDSGDPEPEDH